MDECSERNLDSYNFYTEGRISEYNGKKRRKKKKKICNMILQL